MRACIAAFMHARAEHTHALHLESVYASCAHFRLSSSTCHYMNHTTIAPHNSISVGLNLAVCHFDCRTLHSHLHVSDSAISIMVSELLLVSALLRAWICTSLALAIVCVCMCIYIVCGHGSLHEVGIGFNRNSGFLF